MTLELLNLVSLESVASQLERNESERLYNHWQLVRPWYSGAAIRKGSTSRTIKAIATHLIYILFFTRGWPQSNRAAWLYCRTAQPQQFPPPQMFWIRSALSNFAPQGHTHTKDALLSVADLSGKVGEEIVDRELLWIRDDKFMKDLAVSILRFWVLTLCHLQCTLASVMTSGWWPSSRGFFFSFLFSFPPFCGVSRCRGTSVGKQDKPARWRCVSDSQPLCHHCQRKSVSQTVCSSSMIYDAGGLSRIWHFWEFSPK